MWKMLKIFGIFLAILAGGGLMLPDTVHVERSVLLNKPTPEIFAYLNGYTHFNEWSPWYRLDPQATYRYEGPTQGVGAKMIWSSEKENVGKGSQQIVEVKENELIRVTLDFGDHGTATASYVLTPEAGGTRLVWGFDKTFGYDIAGRYFGLLMERFIGPDYEQGLANLKEIIDGPPKAQ
jgi:uncharacterized protein YndB with AHSA1/START domain